MLCKTLVEVQFLVSLFAAPAIMPRFLFEDARRPNHRCRVQTRELTNREGGDTRRSLIVQLGNLTAPGGIVWTRCGASLCAT